MTTDQFRLAPDAGDSTDVRLGLAHEFRMLSSLRHPNIISVLDYGFDARHQPYFTMDLLENAQTLLVAVRRAAEGASPLAGGPRGGGAAANAV